MDNITKIEVSDQGLALPVDKKRLGEFISGLLGQPQTLESHIDAAFCIDHQWLNHFCSLILQRIQMQNSPEPLAFEAVISYKDGILRKISSRPAFEHFSETQNIISTGIKLSISLLIQFPSKQVPERQEIIVSFDSAVSDSSLFDALLARKISAGKISIEIRHTERTWADDLLRLIEDELKNIHIVESKLKKWMRKAFFPLFSFVPIISTFGFLAYDMWANNSFRQELKNKMANALLKEDYSLQGLHEKVNMLVDYSRIGRPGENDMGYALIVSICASVGMICLGAILAAPNPSFVVLSNAAQRHRTEVLEKQKRKNFWLFASIIGSIFLGVFGNFIYDKLKLFIG